MKHFAVGNFRGISFFSIVKNLHINIKHLQQSPGVLKIFRPRKTKKR